MAKKDDPDERRVRALLRSETAIYERLLAARRELLALVTAIDRLIPSGRRTMSAGIAAGIGKLPELANLIPFRRRGGKP